MTLWTLLSWVLLGVLLAWPCWRLLRRVRHARQPLVCVQPHRPRLAPLDADRAAGVPEAQRDPP